MFVNSSSEYRDNEQLQSYFMPLQIRDGNGDKTMNPVFEKDELPAGAGRLRCVNEGPRRCDLLRAQLDGSEERAL